MGEALGQLSQVESSLTATARAASEASSLAASTMETLTGSGWELRLGLDSARTLRADLTPLLSSEATSRRHSSLGFSSTGKHCPRSPTHPSWTGSPRPQPLQPLWPL